MSNPVQVNMYGIRYFIDGDLSDPHVKKLMVQARNDLQQMKDRNINNIGHIWLDKPNAYKIVSQFGIDSVYINVPEFKKKERKKIVIEELKEKQEIISGLYPAFEVYGYESGTWKQLGYVTGAVGTWKPPYKFWPTENVIPPDLTREQAAAIRADNPSITVDPFMWCQYKAKFYANGPTDIASKKPYDGVLEDKEVLRVYEGDTEIVIVDIATKFEEIADVPRKYNEAGNWVTDDAVEAETKGAAHIGGITFHPGLNGYSVQCKADGYYPGTSIVEYRKPYGAFRHADWSFGEYLAINNVKVDSTQREPKRQHYTWPLLQQSGGCSWGSAYTAPVPDVAAAIAYLACMIQQWKDWAEGGFIGHCLMSPCGALPTSYCDGCANALDFVELNDPGYTYIPASCPGLGVIDAPLGDLDYAELLYGICKKDFLLDDAWPYPNRYASNCKDLSEHVFWLGYHDERDVRSYAITEHIVMDGNYWSTSGQLGCPSAESGGDEYVLRAVETIADYRKNSNVYCIINDRRFPWVEEMNDWVAYLGEYRDDYIEDIHSRYYKIGEEATPFWCLVSAWNYDIDFEMDDSGNWISGATFPDDAEVNRWIFMIYKSENPDHFDMRPGLEFDKNGNQRGSDNSDCVGFDADYDIPDAADWPFAIPGWQNDSGLTDPDGGPLICLGHYRLFNITKIEEPVISKTRQEY